MRCVRSYQDIETPDDYKDNSDYYEEMLEKYVEKWGEQSDEDYDIIHLYWYNIVNDYLDEGILDMSVNEMRESLVWHFKRSSEDKAKDIWVLQEQYKKQKEINKELVDENESLKEQIAELEKSCDETQELLDKQIEATYKLDKENAELKAQLESERDLPAIAYMQGAEKQKKKDEEELQKWKDEWQEQVQKANDEGYARTLQTIQLTKAKEIIKTFCGFCSVFNSTNGSFDNLIAEAEQFLSEVEK